MVIVWTQSRLNLILSDSAWWACAEECVVRLWSCWTAGFTWSHCNYRGNVPPWNEAMDIPGADEALLWIRSDPRLIPDLTDLEDELHTFCSQPFKPSVPAPSLTSSLSPIHVGMCAFNTSERIWEPERTTQRSSSVKWRTRAPTLQNVKLIESSDKRDRSPNQRILTSQRRMCGMFPLKL